MDTKEFLNGVCKEIKYTPARKDIAEELETHIEEIKEEYLKSGVIENEAEEKAILQMGEAEEIGKKLNKIHKPKLDWKLLILIFILIGFGILVTILKDQQPIIKTNYTGKTVLYLCIGIVLSVGIYFFDYKRIKKYSNLIWIIATIIMILPFLIKGPVINYTQYIRFFNVSIFPPTIALPLYLISFIGNIIDYDKNKKYTKKILGINCSLDKDFFKILIFSIISLILMLNIPSIANALILGIAYLIILTIKIMQDKEGRMIKLIALYGSVAIFGIIIICTLIASPFRLKRIVSSFNPESDPESAGYTGMLQKEILENAKIIGEAETDIMSDSQNVINSESNFTFIFIIGKTGLLIAGILLLAIILTSIKLISNSNLIKEEYGKLLIVGISTLYILQSLATVLMNLNLGIQTNINLPFVTYGGVYLVVNLLSMALILAIYRRKDINEYDKNSNRRIINLFISKLGIQDKTN